MGCATCSTATDGTPKGCKNNGTCSSGGCDKLEVYDWLANIALPAGQQPYDIVEVRFKNSRKSFYRNASQLALYAGDIVIVETSPGYDVGVVSVTGELARIQVKKKSPNLKPLEIRKILRIANQEEIDKWIKGRSLEKELMYKARTLALNLNLEMKISDVEYQGDLSKATFYYTAEGRVDFRQLIKDMADHFKVRIEMRQIGSRQEASRLGGIGSCGRELCCTTWLTDFRSVSTSAARYQQLSLNPQKLAGQCGKLKCCLNYELDQYVEAVKKLPPSSVKLKLAKGTAVHFKTDIFNAILYYNIEGVHGEPLLALSAETVRDIIEKNKKGIVVGEVASIQQEVEAVAKTDFAEVVGQDDLRRFDKKKKTNKPGGRSGKRPFKNKGNNQKPNQPNTSGNKPK